MKTLNSTILCFLIIAFSQCKKDKPYVPVKICNDLTANIDTVLMLIHGKWNWLQEKRYNRVKQQYEYLTPKTEEYTLVVEIKGDTAKYYKNGKLDEIYKFKILKESDITNISTDTHAVFAFYNFLSGLIHNYVPIKICSSYLVLDFEATSTAGGEEIWKRR
jgi:bisphosphoglycerate-independent phosphoglycerate mutase (AlkP superfamily)